MKKYLKLGSQDKERLKNYYQKRLKRHGAASPQASDWTNSKQQLLRFDTLCKIGNLNNRKILDFGCGTGDLLNFLQNNFENVKYLGIDLTPEMIAAARQKYPFGNFEIEENNLIPNGFDYILSSGTMAYNVNDAINYYSNLWAELFKKAKIGLSFNVLNANWYTSDKFYLAYKVTELQNICKKISKNYLIVQGYLDGDLTVFFYK